MFSFFAHLVCTKCGAQYERDSRQDLCSRPGCAGSLFARFTAPCASREQSPIWLASNESRPRILPSRSGTGCGPPVPWVSLTGSLQRPYDAHQTRTRVQKFENRVLPGGVGRFPRGTSCGRETSGEEIQHDHLRTPREGAVPQTHHFQSSVDLNRPFGRHRARRRSGTAAGPRGGRPN